MRLAHLLTALLLAFTALPASAQGQFDPVITVGDSVITSYELDQRRRLLELFRTPGDLDQVAREQLVEDRLKQIAFDRAGLAITPEALAREVEAFAARANLSPDQFGTVLAQNGVAFATLEEFVRIGVTWRDFIRARYGDRVTVTDADIDRAARGAGGNADGIEVLLSEIIIPAPPPRAAEAQAIANRIAQTTSQDQFSAFARQYSALPSRSNGGRLNWLPLSNYPPQLHGLILGLAMNEVTAPIGIPNGVALFQMRGVREVASARPTPSAVDYATYYIAGGLTEAGLAAARSVELRVDTCDDLYGVARGQSPDALQRQSLAPGAIPQDIALRLADLDPGEVDYTLTRGNGDTLVFLMLCSREGAGGTIDRDAVETQLRSDRLAGYADALLEDLRASTVIRP